MYLLYLSAGSSFTSHNLPSWGEILSASQIPVNEGSSAGKKHVLFECGVYSLERCWWRKRVLLPVLPTGVQPISGAQTSRVWCDVYVLTTHWVPVIETMTAKIGTIDTIAATSWYLPNCWRPVAMKATRGEPNTAHKRHGARSTM